MRRGEGRFGGCGAGITLREGYILSTTLDLSHGVVVELGQHGAYQTHSLPQ